MTPNAESQPAHRVDERGVALTDEGREEARRKLDAADAHWTPGRRRAAAEAFLARVDAA
jgi:hypothetical protein